MNNFLGLLLSAGGATFLTAIIIGLRNLSSTKLASEAALLQRLNEDAENAREDADNQRARAEKAERYNEVIRKERDAALDIAAKYRRILISQGVQYDETEIED